MNDELTLFWNEDDQAFVPQAPEPDGPGAGAAAYARALARVEAAIRERIERTWARVLPVRRRRSKRSRRQGLPA